MFALPPLTRNIKITLIGLAAIFLVQLLSPTFHYVALRYLTVDAAQVLVHHRYWTLITANLLHGSPSHLLFNGLALYFFGPSVEQRWSSRRFWLFCLACALASSVAVVAWQWVAAASVPTLGYSGVISGLMAAFCLYNWDQRFRIWFVPMTGAALLFLMPVFDLVMVSMGSNVSFAAHLGGLICGVALTQLTGDSPVGPAQHGASQFQKRLLDDARRAHKAGECREAYRLAQQLRATDKLPAEMLDDIWELLAVTAVELDRVDEARSYLKRAPQTAEVRRARTKLDSHHD